MSTTTLDLICLGRLSLDLHALEAGARLEDAARFAKHLGGSAGSIAFGCARLGLRAAMVSHVGDDHAGRFLAETLAAEGCDVSHVTADRRRQTALSLLGIRDRETFSRIAYADDGPDKNDVDEETIAASRALVVTDSTNSFALERARRNGVRTVLAIDQSGAHLQATLDRFDLIVGNREEIQMAGGTGDLLEALRRVRALTRATLVMKLGEGGCAILPAGVADPLTIPGFAVEAVNDLGAGDAFVAGLLKGWLTGMSWPETGRLANACGALVAARHAGSASMPTPAELDYFLSGTPPARPDADPHLARLHRVTPRRKSWDDLCLLAIDDRREAFELARVAGAPESRIAPLKKLLVRAVAETEQALSLHGHAGALIDDTYGGDALLAATGRGFWLARPIEIPGSSPLELEGGRAIGTRLLTWPREHVVKCRVHFDPDGAVDARLEDETQLLTLHRAVQSSGHELLLEVIPPAGEEILVRALKRLYNIGIFPDWWGLEAMPPATWRQVDDLIAARDPWCRGVLAVCGAELGDGASCRGFLAGQAILREPSAAWLAGKIDDDTLVARVRASFEALIGAWRRARASRRERA